MSDLFGECQTVAPQLCDDLFGGKIPDRDPFRWCIAVFRLNGAQITIQNAINAKLETFYPYRLLRDGKTIPFWYNYLFIEWRDNCTLNLCKRTEKFIKMISTLKINYDDEGKEFDVHVPFLLERYRIAETMNMFHRGAFNYHQPLLRRYPKGTRVRVISGDFTNYAVVLMVDVTSDTPPRKKIPVKINNFNATIEVRKLALV